MKFLVVALAIISVCAAQSDADWENFQRNYGKAYRSADEVTSRRAIWENNWKKIKSHNEGYAKGLYTYTLGENQFADMTYEEFARERLGLSEATLKQKHDGVHVIDSSRAAPDSYDLRKLDYVTDVKDQGQCGGCWAFACVAAVETLFLRTRNAPQNIDLSEQHLIDCSKALLLGIIRRNNGCNGGQLASTFDDMKTIAITTEAIYPYTATNGTCQTVPANTNKIAGSNSVSTEQGIIDAVAANNAVTVGIYVSDKFQLYKSGIYVGSDDENKANPNHAVTVIGYDIGKTGAEHYIIKNSWSAKWGENGYFRLKHGGKHLKVDSMACYPK